MKHARRPLSPHRAERPPSQNNKPPLQHARPLLMSSTTTSSKAWNQPPLQRHPVPLPSYDSAVDVTVVVSEATDSSFHHDTSHNLNHGYNDKENHDMTMQVLPRSNIKQAATQQHTTTTAYQRALSDCLHELLPLHRVPLEVAAKQEREARLEARRLLVRTYTPPRVPHQPHDHYHPIVSRNKSTPNTSRASSATRVEPTAASAINLPRSGFMSNRRSNSAQSRRTTKAVATTTQRPSSISPPSIPSTSSRNISIDESVIVLSSSESTEGRCRVAQPHFRGRTVNVAASTTKRAVPKAPRVVTVSHNGGGGTHDVDNSSRPINVNPQPSQLELQSHASASAAQAEVQPTKKCGQPTFTNPVVAQSTPTAAATISRPVDAPIIDDDADNITIEVMSGDDNNSSNVGVTPAANPVSFNIPFFTSSSAAYQRRAPRPLRRRTQELLPIDGPQQVLSSGKSVTDDLYTIDDATRSRMIERTLPPPRPCFSFETVAFSCARDAEAAALLALRPPRTLISTSMDACVSNRCSAKAACFATAIHLIPESVLEAADHKDILRRCLRVWRDKYFESIVDARIRRTSLHRVFVTWKTATWTLQQNRIADDMCAVKHLRTFVRKKLASLRTANVFYRFCCARQCWYTWRRRVAFCHRKEGLTTQRESTDSVHTTCALAVHPPRCQTSSASPQPVEPPSQQEDERSIDRRFVSRMLEKYQATGVEHFDGLPLLHAARGAAAAAAVLLSRYWRQWTVAARKSARGRDLVVIASSRHRWKSLLDVWLVWKRRLSSNRQKRAGSSAERTASQGPSALRDDGEAIVRGREDPWHTLVFGQSGSTTSK